MTNLGFFLRFFVNRAPDHFLNVFNYSLVHSLFIPQVSRESTHVFSSYSGSE